MEEQLYEKGKIPEKSSCHSKLGIFFIQVFVELVCARCCSSAGHTDNSEQNRLSWNLVSSALRLK